MFGWFVKKKTTYGDWYHTGKKNKNGKDVFTASKENAYMFDSKIHADSLAGKSNGRVVSTEEED